MRKLRFAVFKGLTQGGTASNSGSSHSEAPIISRYMLLLRTRQSLADLVQKQEMTSGDQKGVTSKWAFPFCLKCPQSCRLSGAPGSGAPSFALKLNLCCKRPSKPREGQAVCFQLSWKSPVCKDPGLGWGFPASLSIIWDCVLDACGGQGTRPSFLRVCHLNSHCVPVSFWDLHKSLAVFGLEFVPYSLVPHPTRFTLNLSTA